MYSVHVLWQYGHGLGSGYIFVTMTPQEKLAKLLDSDDAGITPTELGDQLRERGVRSGYNLLRKWLTGERAFLPRNQHLVEEILEKPKGWLSSDVPRSAAQESLEHDVLQSFLDSDLANAMEPRPRAGEVTMLRAHHVQGTTTVTERYYFHILMADRELRGVAAPPVIAPETRVNMAAGAAGRAGLKRRARKSEAPTAGKSKGKGGRPRRGAPR